MSAIKKFLGEEGEDDVAGDTPEATPTRSVVSAYRSADSHPRRTPINHSRTMTVGDLVAELQNLDQDLPVYFGYDYGDHWHSEVAGGIKSASEENVIYSDYHNMPKVADEEYDDQLGGDAAVILRSR